MEERYANLKTRAANIRASLRAFGFSASAKQVKILWNDRLHSVVF